MVLPGTPRTVTGASTNVGAAGASGAGCGAGLDGPGRDGPGRERDRLRVDAAGLVVDVVDEGVVVVVVGFDVVGFGLVVVLP